MELLLACAALGVLLAVLVPSMQRARMDAWSAESRSNLQHLHRAWDAWLTTNDEQFPYVPTQPGWRWGGVRFSAVTGNAFLDSDRPLTRYFQAESIKTELFRAPADRGIRGEAAGAGTGDRTCFEAFGTSYRANDRLLDASRLDETGSMDDEAFARGLRLAEVRTASDRLVILGEPLWAEIRRGTFRDADWYGRPGHANLLFLDGHTDFLEVEPTGRTGRPVFDPRLRDLDAILDGGSEATPAAGSASSPGSSVTESSVTGSNDAAPDTLED